MEKKSIEYVLPEEIEKRSFEIIAAELAERGITLPAEQDPVTRRVIHTCLLYTSMRILLSSRAQEARRRSI